MKVVVTGATAPLGRAAIERFAGAGFHVVAASEQAPAPGVRTLRLDLRDESSVDVLAAELDSETALVHLDESRAEGTRTERSALIQSNVLGTMRALDAARRVRRGVRMVVYASTVEVYDPSAGSASESAPTGPASAYAATKLAGEDLLLAFGEEEGTRVVSLRFADLYGPFPDLAGPAGRLVARAREAGSEFQAASTDPHDLLHVDDAASALTLALTRDSHPIVNVSDGAVHSLDELARVLAGVSGSPPVASERGCHMIIDRARAELGFSPAVALGPGAFEQGERGRERHAP